MKAGRLPVALSTFDRLQLAKKLVASLEEELAEEKAKLSPEALAKFEEHAGGVRDLISEMSGGQLCRRDRVNPQG